VQRRILSEYSSVCFRLRCVRLEKFILSTNSREQYYSPHTEFLQSGRANQHNIVSMWSPISCIKSWTHCIIVLCITDANFIEHGHSWCQRWIWRWPLSLESKDAPLSRESAEWWIAHTLGCCVDRPVQIRYTDALFGYDITISVRHTSTLWALCPILLAPANPLLVTKQKKKKGICHIRDSNQQCLSY
jgi:hypothetical protein